MSEQGNRDYFSQRRREKNRSVLRVLPKTTSKKTREIGGEGLYKGKPQGDMKPWEKERKEKFEKIKPYLLGMMKNCERAAREIKKTQLFTQTKEEDEYFSLLDTLIIEYKDNIKTSILTDKLVAFKDLIQRVAVAYKSSTQHIKDTPYEAIQLIVEKRNFPEIDTLKKSFEAVYLAKKMYDETLIDPFWNTEFVDEEEASVFGGAVYYASIFEGHEQEQALENVVGSLQDEFGFAINREIALDYVKNTVYSKYRPKK